MPSERHNHPPRWV